MNNLNYIETIYDLRYMGWKVTHVFGKHSRTCIVKDGCPPESQLALDTLTAIQYVRGPGDAGRIDNPSPEMVALFDKLFNHDTYIQ